VFSPLRCENDYTNLNHNMNETKNKIDKIIQIIFLILFFTIICFGIQKSYLLGIIYYLVIFALLALIPVIIKESNISKLKISLGKNKNIILEKFNTEIKNIIKSNRSDDDKIEESQKLIDESFEIGYKMGSGKNINKIQNVKFVKDENGKIEQVQFDEN